MNSTTPTLEPIEDAAVRGVLTLTAREYLRVSRDKSGRSKSVTDQHKDNTDAAADQGWRLGDPYEDNDRSASRYATKIRKGFDRLMADLEAGTFGADVLVLWEPSRGSRRASEWTRLLELLRDRGVLVYVTSHHRTYDPRNGRDMRNLQEDGVDSEYESYKTSERIRRGVAAAAKEGRPGGPTPFGYIRRYDPHKKTLIAQEADPETAPLVAELYAHLAAKKSLRSIQRDWIERGILSSAGTPYTLTRLRNIALNPVYAGLRAWTPSDPVTGEAPRPSTAPQRGRTELIPGMWDGIVSEETYWKVHDFLTNPSRSTSRPARAAHLLSNIAICDVCKGPLSFRRSRHDSPIYVCKNGNHLNIGEAALDEIAEDAILTYLEGEDFAKDARAAEAATAGTELQTVRDEIAALRHRLDEITDAVAAGEMSPVMGGKSEAKVMASLADAESRERTLAAPVGLQGMIEPGDGVRARWKSLVLEQRRAVARYVFSPDVLGRLRVTRSPKQGTVPAPAEDRVLVKPGE